MQSVRHAVYTSLTILTSGQARNLVVLSDITVQTNVFEVLPHQVSGRITLTSALARRLQVIKLLYELGKTLLNEFVPRYPRVETMIEAYRCKLRHRRTRRR